MKIFSKGTLSTFDLLLISGVVFFNILHSTLVNELNLIGSLASVSGVICVVLVAKRSMSNYLFGIINVSLYAYISYKASIYGDFLLNAFYYLP
ncbi:MAG: nicotinamide riboside transporter PnuC, partial [Lachnospiraceae bacterium]